MSLIDFFSSTDRKKNLPKKLKSSPPLVMTQIVAEASANPRTPNTVLRQPVPIRGHPPRFRAGVNRPDTPFVTAGLLEASFNLAQPPPAGPPPLVIAPVEKLPEKPPEKAPEKTTTIEGQQHLPPLPTRIVQHAPPPPPSSTADGFWSTAAATTATTIADSRGQSWFHRTAHELSHGNEVYVRNCLQCEQRQLERHERELASTRVALQKAEYDLRLLEHHLQFNQDKNKELQRLLHAEKQRADECTERTKSFLVDRIGTDLAKTQHNLASGFPPNSKLRDRYMELMTTGARQDLIDAVCQSRNLCQLIEPSLAQKHPPSDKLNFADLDAGEEFTLKLEHFIGMLIIDMHAAVESLFAQLPWSVSQLVTNTLPLNVVAVGFSAALKTPLATEALRETFRSQHAILLDYVKNISSDPLQNKPPSKVDMTSTATAPAACTATAAAACTATAAAACTATAAAACAAASAPLAPPPPPPPPPHPPVAAVVVDYINRASPMVSFGLQRSAAAHHLIEFINECFDLCRNTKPEGLSEIEQKHLKQLSLSIPISVARLDKFVAECLEFFWMLNLSVPRVSVEVTFAKETQATHYKRHILIPPSLRNTLPIESIAYPPLVAIDDGSVKSLLFHGLCL